MQVVQKAVVMVAAVADATAVVVGTLAVSLVGHMVVPTAAALEGLQAVIVEGVASHTAVVEATVAVLGKVLPASVVV